MLRALVETLDEQLSEASSRPRERREVQRYAEEEDEPFGGEAAGGDQPCAKAVFEFDAENEGELSFPEVGERLPPPPFGCCWCWRYRVCHCAVQPLSDFISLPCFLLTCVHIHIFHGTIILHLIFLPMACLALDLCRLFDHAGCDYQPNLPSR